jgi:thioredoxin 1
MATENIVRSEADRGAAIQTFTDSNFEATVLKADRPVLVDFWAEWCGPCRRLAPAVDAVALDYSGKLTVGKLNVDENQDTTIRFNVRGIPALLLFKGGQLVDQIVGLVPKDEIKKVIDRHL